jgi:hypothetical protein
MILPGMQETFSQLNRRKPFSRGPNASLRHTCKMPSKGGAGVQPKSWHRLHCRSFVDQIERSECGGCCRFLYRDRVDHLGRGSAAFPIPMLNSYAAYFASKV